VSALTEPALAAGDNRHVAQRVSSPEFVGRGEQIAALEAALERAEGGEARAVFVAGESGVGKTRLLRELERRAAERGARILRGECVAFGAGELPYAPIAAAVRGLARELAPEEFDALVGPGRAELARLVPELSAADAPALAGLAATGAPLAQAHLFGVVRGLLDRLAAEGPVVFAIEDLHWADRSTLEFLSSLLRWLRDERLLLVCTYRSDELHRRHPLRPFLAEEERSAAVARVELEPFSVAELTTQVTGILGDAPEPGLVTRLHERSEGNAFFAEELLAASAEATGPLPTSLRDVLILRLEAVPGDGREALRVAAAAGRRTGHRLLAAVAKLPEDELLEALRGAIAHHVLVQDADGYAFRHALLQEAAYADLLAGERTGLHLALAEALSADPSLADGTAASAAAELAHHWRAAHRLPDALAAHVRAGLEAEAVYAFAEAAQQLETALELWDEVGDAEARAGLSRAEVLGRTAEATQLSGNHPRAVALGREAVALASEDGDVVRLAMACERLGRYLWLSGDSDGALVEHREAVRLMPQDEPTPELARVLASYGQILMLRAPGDESNQACRQAIEIANAVGARGVAGHALNSLGISMCATGNWEEAERSLREAMGIAEELDEPDDICRAYVNLADCIDQQGRVEESTALALEGAAIAERLGIDSYDQFKRGEAAWKLARLGRVDEAEDILAPALAGRPTGTSAIVLQSNSGHIALRRGRLDQALEHFRRARDVYGATTDSMWVGNAASGEIEAELWRQDADVEDAWRRAAAVLASLGGHEYAFYIARLHATVARAAAEVALRARSLGDAELAAEAQRSAAGAAEGLSELLRPERWPGGPPPPETLAFAAQCRAEAARAAGAPDPETWAAAAEGFARLAHPFELGYARWRQAEAIVLAGGDRAAAAEVLAEAAALAAHVDARRLGEEIAAFARRARLDLGGATIEPAATDDGEVAQLGLTARERAVLELVAEGHTNREIGEALFMAEKTASVHVSRILSKLGVKSRVEAATIAYRLGLMAAESSAPGDGGRR
jgi:DNA-binding CsgD family transcriptional regulator/Tfp pilus assembly protein PilF